MLNAAGGGFSTECVPSLIWQGDTDGSPKKSRVRLAFSKVGFLVALFILRGGKQMPFHFPRSLMRWPFWLCTLPVLTALSRLHALPEHLPQDGGAGNGKLTRAAEFPLQKPEAQSKGTQNPMCASCKMAPSLVRIIKTLVSPLKYIVVLMSGVYNSKSRYNVIFCHV